MKTIKAGNLIKTLKWISEFENGISEIEPKQSSDGTYECTIELPNINKTVIGLGKTKIESIDNVTRESAKLIDEYLKNHPDKNVNDTVCWTNYVLEENDEGQLCMHVLLNDMN